MDFVRMQRGEKMSRLIDADALKKKYTMVIKRTSPSAIMERPAILLEDVDEAPTIDAVEVVRCKDCRWFDKTEDSSYGYCHAMKHAYLSKNWEISIYRTYKEDFYCADGEKREVEE